MTVLQFLMVLAMSSSLILIFLDYAAIQALSLQLYVGFG